MTQKFSHFDELLYFLCGFLPVLVASADPLTWRAWGQSLVAGIVAVKAKRSPGTDQK